MSNTLKTISPVDGSVYVERPYADESEVASALALAKKAQAAWRQTSIAERAALCSKAVDAFVASKQDVAEEISWMMGRPVRSTPGEVGGLEERARHMIAIAEPITCAS